MDSSRPYYRQMAFAPSRFRAQPSIGTLWPPDHSMVKVSILGVVDPNNNARMASHTMLMFLAVICAHFGGALSRKGRTDLMRYRGAAIAYTISLLLMLSGIPWWRPLLRLGS